MTRRKVTATRSRSDLVTARHTLADELRDASNERALVILDELWTVVGELVALDASDASAAVERNAETIAAMREREAERADPPADRAVTLRVTRGELTYGGTRYRFGDVFNVHEDVADGLVRGGKCRLEYRPGRQAPGSAA